MRIRIPVIAYITATVVGTGVLMIPISIFDPAPSIEFLFIFPMVVAILGSVIALPVAVPAILFTERRKEGPAWLFLAAGLGFAVLIVGLLSWFVGSLNFQDVPRVFFGYGAATVAASMTYWLLAWRLNPPREDVGAMVEEFR